MTAISKVMDPSADVIRSSGTEEASHTGTLQITKYVFIDKIELTVYYSNRGDCDGCCLCQQVPAQFSSGNLGLQSAEHVRAYDSTHATRDRSLYCLLFQICSVFEKQQKCIARRADRHALATTGFVTP